ncbi:hypothetical protein MTR_8g080530 [Medicago truncatula]|uniref:Uncharacterized protein n=1 Tax=Medicago truncatula TaxID=3880 RepID=A0A072U425_MEDTR|nr:hypothetical protein MTR_8g080530 [Medicago truncatula]
MTCVFHRFKIDVHKDLNPFGVSLVVGLGSWSVLLSRSQARSLWCQFRWVSPYRALLWLRTGLCKWTVGLVPSN